MAENCNTKDCPLVPRVDALEKCNERHSETHQKLFDRLNKVETENAVQGAQFAAIMEKLDRMDVKHDRLVDKMDSLESTVSRQEQTLNELNERGKNNQARLDALEAKPGKRWDGMVEKFIAGVVGAVATGIFGGIIYLLTVANG